MDIFLGILAWMGCWSAAMINAPEYSAIKAISDTNDGKLSYRYIKMTMKGYNLVFLIFLNFFCFITQFFNFNNDLKFVLFSINGIFFINVLWDIVVNSYNKNYIVLLQNKLAESTKLSYMFDLEENCTMPTECDVKYIYVIFKNKIYYKDDRQTICLHPKKFGYKKTPIKYGEIRYIVEQLNKENKAYNENIEVKTFFNHPDLREYSSYFVFDEVKNNKFRRWMYKHIVVIGDILKSFLWVVYMALGIIAFASIFGSNWFRWFNL